MKIVMMRRALGYAFWIVLILLFVANGSIALRRHDWLDAAIDFFLALLLPHFREAFRYYTRRPPE